MKETDWINVMSPYYKHCIWIHKAFAKSVNVHPVYLFVLAHQMLDRISKADWYGEVTGDVAAQKVEFESGDVCVIEKPFRYYLGFWKDKSFRVYGEGFPPLEEVKDHILMRTNGHHRRQS